MQPDNLSQLLRWPDGIQDQHNRLPHIHTARRSCITGLADFGVNVYTIQRIAGHARISTTQKYIQLSTATIEADLRKAFPKDRQVIIPEAVPLPKELEFAEAEEIN